MSKKMNKNLRIGVYIVNGYGNCFFKEKHIIKNWILIILIILLIFFLTISLLSSAQQQEAQISDELTALAKEFITLLEKGDFSKAVENFDSTMIKVMPEDKLKEVWNSIVTQLGSFKRQGKTRTEKVMDYDIVYVTCVFQSVALDAKVVFNRKKQISGLFFIPSQAAIKYRPPAYVKPDLFQEKEVVVGSGEWALPGTLTLPEGNGPYPAVVLVHGSGPNDRDETIGPNKPFRDLAWGLASRNIAVLRYEKRTKAHSQKFASRKVKLTVKEETIDDAVAAVRMLLQTEGIDGEKIFVIGHSLGGMLIPRIGALDSEIAGFIVLAGTTRPLEDVILEQMNYIFSVDGGISEDEKNKLDKIKKQVEKVKNLKETDVSSRTDYFLGAPAEYWLDLRGYNPPQAARDLKQPMLILQGGRDYQVTEEDFKGWKKSLSSRNDVEFRFYPNLNHLFIEGKGKITPAEYQVTSHVAEIVINDIAKWIKAH